jgi:hypothetical protein
MLLPGFLLALGLLPVLRTIIELADGLVPLEYAFTVEVFFWGWLIVILDMPIYMIFEGRRYWLKSVKKFFISQEKNRLSKLERIIDDYPQRVERQKYIEASVEIRRFPLDENGKYEVRFPTRLGNLLTAYEEYSKRIYGMWQGFYWPRIWLKIDKDIREEIDGQQAFADSTIYTVTVLYINTILFSIYAILYLYDMSHIKYLPRAPFYWILPIVSLTTGYAIYRLSLHIHAQFGETFKSVFDKFGHETMFPKIIEALASFPCTRELKTASYEDQNLAVWFYLHNYRIKCLQCGDILLPAEAREHRCKSVKK